MSNHLCQTTYVRSSYDTAYVRPPLYVVTCQAELPVLHSSFPLAICFTCDYISQCYSFNLSHPLLSPPCPQVLSLCLHLYSCPANRFIVCTIFPDCWYIYTMEYYSITKRNAFESVLVKWINVESVVQSEVRQRKTNFVY